MRKKMSGLNQLFLLGFVSQLNLCAENNKKNKFNKYGCLSITLCFLSIFVSSYFYVLHMSSSQEVWIWNHSDTDIFITNCYLNGKSLDKCAGKLLKNQAWAVDPKTILYSPEQNHFLIELNKNQIKYKYECNFYRKKMDCQEETAINNKGFGCEKYCSSIYD